MNRSGFVAIPLAALLLAFNTVDSQAADAELKREVEKLFEIGWPASYKTRALADEQFGTIQQVSPGDVRAVYAYALVQIKQRRYPDAAKLLGQLLDHDPQHIHAAKAKAWLSMLGKNYSQSLIELDQLVQMKSSSDEEQLENVRYAGRMVGYLEGPADGVIKETTLQAAKRKIISRLDDKQIAAFDKARDGVIETHHSFSLEQEQTAEEAKVQAEKDRERERKELAGEQTQLEERRAEIAPEIEKLKSEAKDELKAIEDEDKPLVDQLRRLETEAIATRREQSLYTSDIIRLQGQLDRAEDPGTRGLIQSQINQVSILSNRYDAQVRLLERQAQSIVAQRVKLKNDYDRMYASYSSQIQKLGGELKEIDKLDKRNTGLQKKAEKPSTADLRRTRAIAARAKALSTYEDLSLDLEREWVLQSLR